MSERNTPNIQFGLPPPMATQRVVVKPIQPVFRRPTGEVVQPARKPTIARSAPILAQAPFRPQQRAIDPIQPAAQAAPSLPFVLPSPSAPPDSHAYPDSIAGEITFIQMYRSWGRGEVLTDRGQSITIVGNGLEGLEQGGRYLLKGKFINHPRFGRQLDVMLATTDMESHGALIRHIGKNFKGAGKVTSQRLIDLHESRGTLDALRHQLTYSPSLVDFSEVTTRVITLIDDKDSNTSRIVNALSLEYGDLGIPSQVMKKIASVLLAESLSKLAVKDNTTSLADIDLVQVSSKILKANPYLFIDKVSGYTFNVADRIGRKIDFDRNDPLRLAALVGYALAKECEASGHSYLLERDLCAAINQIDRQVSPLVAIDTAREHGTSLVVDDDFGDLRYYAREIFVSESQVVDAIVFRMTHRFEPLAAKKGVLPSDDEINAIINQAQEIVREKKGFTHYELDPSQRSALLGILTSDAGIHTLTAGPGCGKTDIMEMLLTTLDLLEVSHKYTFCAPVGKAAKVLGSRIGAWQSALTIHSLLQYQGNAFNVNESNPLDTSMNLLDEGSMLGTPLGGALLSSLPASAHFISLGDVEQLSPIEPGEVLRSLLEFEDLDHHRLTKTHRNQGAIKSIVDSVKAGEWNPINDDMVQCLGELPEPSPNNMARLAHEVIESAHRYGGLEHVGVITPYRRGNVNEPGWNVTYLNGYLRERINPESDSSPKVAGTSLRLNDRIIITENQNTLDDQRVVNGDTGVLTDVVFGTNENGQRALKEIVIQLDGGERVRMSGDAVDTISLAYAITTHAAQGSEYKAVYALCPDGHKSFMHRYMLITMLSRAREKLVVYGSDTTLAKIAQREPPARNCAIVERVTRSVYEQDIEEQRRASRLRGVPSLA